MTGVGWTKAKRAHHSRMRLPMDGGHGARCAFCPPYGVNFKRRHSQPHFRDLAAVCASCSRIFRLLMIRGRRECRAPDAPAVLRAKVRVARTQVITVTPESPGIPRAMVYGLFRALPGDRALLPPSFREITSRTLTPASGCQDHTTLPSASSALVSRAVSVHRNPPHVRDDRETPLLARRDNSLYSCCYRVVKLISEIQK
jgi:hypothetical protein